METKTNCPSRSNCLPLGCRILQNLNAVNFSKRKLYIKNHSYLDISIVTTTCRCFNSYSLAAAKKPDR